ncbi:hypothetical protein T11_676 [Trichinella zimbabwensis]|uniref:Uncharacterized protein n=1 Tax=Trichinella zimbabwensis TaxID=268475 RepID=A0A0V1HMT0_9BILA|nr:hypothetical protein T11_676 [Trichinella zimbabwensis]
MELMEAIETPPLNGNGRNCRSHADGRCNAGERWRITEAMPEAMTNDHSPAEMSTWRITEVFAGADGVVRSAKVKTGTGII